MSLTCTCAYTYTYAYAYARAYTCTYTYAILAWQGYQHSVSSRYLHDTLVPSWSDLMLWAVLTGEDQLVQPLWAKTRDPLRAALLASKCVMRLSTLPHLRSDLEHLRELAVEYEDWAIGLLDAVDEAEVVLPVLAMIPSLGYGHALWPNSCIELAVDFSGKASPCRRFVAHRHTQYLLDSFFAGDYPNSKARVNVDAGLLQILMQCLFFFLPVSEPWLILTHASSSSSFRQVLSARLD